MRHIATIVEQLDRAAIELATDHPINNRLALILIDNAVELIIHRQCTDRLEQDDFVSSLWKTHQALAKDKPREESLDDLRKDMMTQGQRSKARGKYFGDKLIVLEQTQTERRFIAVVHHHRNELYHVGLAHDDIIRAMAFHYFFLCCDLFVRMGNLSLFGPTFSSDDKYTDVLARYLPIQDGRVDIGHVDKEELASKLSCTLPEGIPNLAQTLADSARKSIRLTVEMFHFLVINNPFGLDHVKTLEVVQWRWELTKLLENKHVDGVWADPDYQRQFTQTADELAANWHPKCSSLPDDKWIRNAVQIETEPDPLSAMYMYRSLRKDMSYLEEAIQSAELELDAWIQMEVDKARGK